MLKKIVSRVKNKVINVFLFSKIKSTLKSQKALIIPRTYRKIVSKILQDKRIADIGATDAIKSLITHCASTYVSPAATYCEVANFLFNAGQHEIAQTYYLASLNLAMTPSTYSLYLQCLLLSPTCTETQMHKAASTYSQLFLKHIKKYDHHSNDLNPNRKLNIGYICHFFHNSVSQSLLIPFLQAHNRERVTIFCYSDTTKDEVPETIKQVGDAWRDTKHMSDEALAELIRADKIDVLIELNGHCTVNRYGVIASKPAPIQVSFYNIATTSGVTAIDYIIIGDEVTLNKPDALYTETVYYIKGVTGTAKFADDFPDGAPPPCLKNNYITFGSFNASHKVNKFVIKLWCDVLKAVPNSKFYMKAGALTHKVFNDIYRKMFHDNGIGDDRIYLDGFSEHKKMLGCYEKVDIALDTFPHAGGTTSMEAIWQGVPVLTLCGEKYSMQLGRMIANSIGHPELVSYSEEEFISKAAELASRPDLLVQYRHHLREDFRKSPRADAAGLAAKLDDAYHDMWKKYLNKLNNFITTPTREVQ